MSVNYGNMPVIAVRLIVRNPENRILLLKRHNSGHGNGMWCLPGGKVDYLQTIGDACRNELFEETSLKAVSLEFLFYQDSLPVEPDGMHCVNLYFECIAAGKVKLNNESDDHRWISKSEINDYDIAFRNDEALMKYWSVDVMQLHPNED